jgi:aspartyl-tRNA(Asn)/glutamyl-tRNA(Gln) amidotransferase subunit C
LKPWIILHPLYETGALRRGANVFFKPFRPARQRPPPMPLTLTDVSRIAHLARLELQPSQAEALLGQLNGFFVIVEQMSAVDTRGVEPLYTPLAAVQASALRLRDDVVTETNEPQQRERCQASAPAVEDGLFLVPKVIE